MRSGLRGRGAVRLTSGSVESTFASDGEGIVRCRALACFSARVVHDEGFE